MRADRLGPALATQAALATTIVLVVFGSSGVQALRSVGSPLRWLALAVLAAAALAWARAAGARVRRLQAAEGALLLLTVLALASSAWSVAPRLSFERAVTFAVVVVAAAATGAAVRAVPAAAERVGATVVVTAVAVAVAGVVVYAVDPARGAQAASAGTAFRFSGIGENPNTIPMLAAVAAPLAVWLAQTSSGRRPRLAWLGAMLVLCAEIIASGSRGALAGGIAAAAVLALLLPGRGRRRAGLAVAALVIAVALVAGNRIVQDTTALPVAPLTPASHQPARLPRVVLGSFADELGTIPHSGRTLIGNDGRLGAWQEAFDEGSTQPAFGFGFGTEERVFVDRLAQFHASRPENSYFGLYLELGAAGVVLLLAFGVLVAIAAVRARALEPRARAAAAGTAASVAAGFGLAFGQSFVYAAGNVAMLPFWISAFLLLAVAPPSRRRGPIRVVLAAVVLIAVAIPVGRWERTRAIASQRDGIVRVWDAVGGRVDAPSLDGFRLSPPVDCLLYDAPAYELCFDRGSLVEAYDRRNGFHGWTLQQYGYADAPLTVPPASIDHELRGLHANARHVTVGPAYLARNAR